MKQQVKWREFIQQLKPDTVFNPPAMPTQITSAERTLRIVFPVDLKHLLQESNGIEDWLLSAEQIAKVNSEFRTGNQCHQIYMPFDGLLFFLHDGTGSYYAFPICGGLCDQVPSIFYWCHETDDRTMIAQSLPNALQKYLRG
jgi:cell wall assembly regulator SMI1